MLQLSGADRVRYLNGQVSNDVTRATWKSAIEACVCNLKGKLDGVVFITASVDGGVFLIDAPGELRDSLFARLDRYIIKYSQYVGGKVLSRSPAFIAAQSMGPAECVGPHRRVACLGKHRKPVVQVVSARGLWLRPAIQPGHRVGDRLGQIRVRLSGLFRQTRPWR